ncbi:putative membrane protein [Halanaeroarchaeum sp. HSR-CO]|uniref:DUF7533 family protein n=1 Tax=Halanaeroarchaeum sp. HSR-CO TaxID=2866382 RepID=UPI00217D4EF6|nr:hypothetical protein [Halanaeroarchaeum sp. HSR-CO]UWG46524.1 putative membrane protein [Halanaeroarchaeum sp. HSR-CO]
MERLGIVDLITLGTTLVFALPIGIYGLQLLLDGRTALGLTGISVAVGLVLVERLLWTPGDVPVTVGKRLVNWVIDRPIEDTER